MSQSLFTVQTPALPDINDGGPITVGTTLTFDAVGTVSGIRFFAPLTPGSSIFEGTLWVVTTDDSTGAGAGTLLGHAVFGTIAPGAWNTVAFSSPVAVDTTHVYVSAIRTTQGRYVATSGFFSSAPLVNGHITGLKDGAAAGGFAKLFDGRFFTDTSSYPNQTFGSNCYFADVLYDPSSPDVTLAATFTATGSMTAAVTAEADPAATLTGTGGMSAALTVEDRAAATLGATAGMTANLTVVNNSGPQDPIGTPVAEQLLACLTTQLLTLPKPPALIQLRVGQEAGPLIGANVDECCAGLAWVRIANIYPSWDSFPAPDTTWLPCGPLAYAVVLEMGVVFCMPWSDSDDSFDNIDPPNEQDWADAFTTQMQHQTLMRRAAACCFRATQRRAVGEWLPLSVEGGCTGGTLRVTVSVMAPCGDC